MNGTVVNGGRWWSCQVWAGRWLAVLGILVGAGAVPAAENTAPRKALLTTEVYSLETQDPVSLAEVLGKLTQGTAQDRKPEVERVVIAPDKTTHSVIVRANQEDQEWIAKLIAQLDKRSPQVLIDVTLVEITKADRFDYDLNLVRRSPDLTRTLPTPPAEPNAAGPSSLWRGRALPAFYDDAQIQALVSAVISKDYGRVLAKPKLLVNDRQKGTVETKETTYAKVTSETYQPCEAGLKLDITPHVLERDLLQLDVALAKSDFSKHASAKPPDGRSSKLDCSVVLPNGCTVILGGMFKLDNGGSKVPILGDFPLIGGLFRSNNADGRSYLYVFVKAEVIRAEEHAGVNELEALSERNRAAFERHELELQTHQDWPGSKAKRVEPAPVIQGH